MTRELTVAIIGTGFGGVGMAIQLARAGLRSFTLFEKADRPGGTWRDNIYPGAACDVPSHLYSFSFEPKPDWSRRFAEQGEILAYLEHCIDRYRLAPHIRTGVEIVAADFDEGAGEWRLRSAAGETFRARVLVSACGQLNRPSVPALPGAASFRGAQFHSARWDASCPLDGRRVAVIGTGASAIQIVPHVAARAGRLSVFQRSPPWIVPKPDRAYLPVEKRLFRALPLLQALNRLDIYCRLEARFATFRAGSVMNRLARRIALDHLRRSVADAALRATLTPDHEIGCKRILISNDYYPALCRSNVSLIADEVVALDEDAVVTRDGRRHPSDVVIYATGFHATDFLAPLAVTGRGGLDLAEAWRGGAEAYLGISVSGFPNLFVLYGPNTNLAHNSIIFMLESQIAYVMACLRTLGERDLRFLDLRADRSRSYNAELEERLGQAVWATGCSSWYRTAAGKNTNNWPGFTVEYRRRTSRVDLTAYELK